MASSWARFAGSGGSVAALAFVLLLTAVALGARWLAPVDPSVMSEALLAPPSPQHVFGTDELGRDVVSEVIYGARISLVVGLAAAAAATILGILVGVASGYYSGPIDATFMRISEFFQVLPTFVLAALIVAMLGPGAGRIVAVIALLAWPRTARLARGEVLRLKRAEFVEAARSIGMPDVMIMRRQIVPNALPPVVAAGTLIIGQAILLEASLAFLGLGDPSLVSWGKILNSGERFLFSAWWLSVVPGCAILLTVLAFNLLSDGIMDVLDPHGRVAGLALSTRLRGRTRARAAASNARPSANGR